MMKEGGMFDDKLTLVKLTSIFSDVNIEFGESGDNSDEQELVYEEWLEVC